tara:strand:+ start:2249 stop:2509 length:261 start_codon:yes stop_codon:yes gene_type:complete
VTIRYFVRFKFVSALRPFLRRFDITLRPFVVLIRALKPTTLIALRFVPPRVLFVIIICDYFSKLKFATSLGVSAIFLLGNNSFSSD